MRAGEGIEAAFEYAAAGKGRAFVDLLASTRFDLSAVGADDGQFKHDWERYRALRQEIDNLLVQLTGDQGETRGMSRHEAASASQEGERIPAENLYAQLRAKQEEAGKHWKQMTFRYPQLTACESAPTLTALLARDLSAQLAATLVEYYQHAAGWCAFVVTPDDLRYVALPDLTDDLLEEMNDWVEGIKSPSGRADWTIEILDEWYEAVIAPLALPQSLPTLGGKPNSPPALPQSLPTLGGKSISPLSQSWERGAGGVRAVLSPFGALSRLPLFAARHPESKRYMAQEYSLRAEFGCLARQSSSSQSQGAERS